MRIDGTGGLRAEVNGGYHYGVTNIADGRWHHVAAVVDRARRGELRLYLDGQEVTARQAAQPLIPTPDDDRVWIAIGASMKWYAGGEHAFPGIDHAMLRWFVRGEELTYVLWTDLPGGEVTWGTTAGKRFPGIDLEAARRVVEAAGATIGLFHVTC